MEEVKELSEKQVWDVLQFAQSLSSFQYGMGVYTPQMLNSTLIDLNNNPQVATEQRITRALNEYKSTARELQAMNEFMEYTDMLFKRTLSYYVNTLAFDLQVSCKNAYDTKDYKSKEYKEDKQRVYRFLDSFDYKAEFLRMAREICRRETVYTWFRDDGTNKTLQTMPQQYCMLTGYFPQGLLYNFDMAYFLKAGVDIDNFDPVFKTYYYNVFGNPNSEPYRQSKNLNTMDNTFAFWTEVSPNEGAWAFKFDMSNFNSVPFLSAMMKDSILNDTIRKLQKDKRMMEAQKLIIGEMPLLSDTKISKPDQFAIDPTTMGKLLAMVRGSVSDNYKFGGLPMKEVEEYTFEDKNVNSFSNQLATTSGMGASASRIIYSNDRLNQEELRQSMMNDYQTMRAIYSQFNNFLDFFVNKKTRKYKFRFTFEGSTFDFERKARQDAVMRLAENGIVLKSAIQSAFGYKPQEFEAMLIEAKAEGFELASIHTASSKNESGRPTNAESNEVLTESGEKTQNNKVK